MKLKQKLFLLFVSITAALFISFYYLEHHHQGRVLQEQSIESSRQAERMFKGIAERDINALSAALEIVVQDRELKKIYIEKDREKLFHYAQPLFENLKNRYGISHAYFILPDGHVFTRLHNKNIFGDMLERITFIKARETGQLSTGIELGKTAFALRAVMPYYDDGKLIGYVELGEEIDHFLNILKADTHNEFSFIADKIDLNRDDWGSVRQEAGLGNNWDSSEHHLIVGSTTNKEFAAICFSDENIEQVEKGKDIFIDSRYKDRSFLCNGFIFKDPDGKQIGTVLSLIDITKQVAAVQKDAKATLYFAIIMFLLSLIPSYAVSSSISRPLAKLKDMTKNIGRGNLDVTIDSASADEIGELARSFKEMAENLQKTIVTKDYVDNIFRNMIDTLIVISPDGRIARTNSALNKLLGYGEEELTGQKAEAVFYGGPQKNSLFLKDLFTWRYITNIEKDYMTKDGRKIPMLFSASVMLDNNNNVQGVVCAAQDITERKKAETMLYQAKQDWEDTFNMIPDMITVHDRDYNIIRANRAAAKLLNLPDLEKVLNVKCFKFYHGTDHPPEGCPSCNCLKTEKDAVFEVFEPHLNMLLEVRAMPSLDKNNKLIGLIHVVRDITKSKEAEVAAKRARSEWETTFDNTGELIALIDGSGKILRCNRSFARFVGRTFNEVIGCQCTDLIPISPEQIRPGMPETKIEITTENGEWLYISFCPIPDEKGRFQRGVVVCTDITGLKYAQEKLIKSEKELKSRVEDLERFYEMAIARELKMKQLKKDIRKLEARIPETVQNQVPNHA